MFCPNCGNEIKEGKSFCTNCGMKIKSNKTTVVSKKIPITVISILTFCVILLLICYFLFFHNQNSVQSEQAVNNTIEQRNQIQEKTNRIKEIKKTPSDILDEINSYQAKYWEIVKRHDTLLMTWSDDDKEKDREELDRLFKEVINNIDSNNEYLEKYNEVEKEFENNSGETTVEMNEFASRYYEAVDKLLNDTYKAVKTKLNEEDFEQLKLTQRKWLKEVQAYYSVFEEQEFGTIRTIIHLDYEINMRNFRTLLLMLYL